MVRGGEVVTTYRRYDTALLIFLLRQRRAGRFGAPMPGPGDPVYERLRAEWDAEVNVSAEEVRASLDAKLARFREAVLLARRTEGDE